MREFKLVKIDKTIPISIKCNMCKKEMITDISPFGNGVNVCYEGGYDSDFFGDGSYLEFDICEECLFKKIINQLRILPYKEE